MDHHFTDEKLRLTEVKRIIQGNTATWWQSRDLSLNLFDSVSHILWSASSCLSKFTFLTSQIMCVHIHAVKIQYIKIFNQ